MPFTPSHAVVALPFAGTVVPVGAVAVGSMTPDLPLFFPVGIDYGDTHGFPGMFLVSFPLAIGLYLVWMLLLRPVASELSPRWLGSRLPADWEHGMARRRTRHPGRSTALALAALLFGVITHVVWDAFTHTGRWGSVLIPALNRFWGPLPIAQWLQYVSSAAGLIGLAVWAVLWLRRAPAHRPAELTPAALRRTLWWSVPVALACSLAYSIAAQGSSGRYALIVDIGTRAGALILLVLVVCAGLAHGLRQRAMRRISAVEKGDTPGMQG